MVGVKGRSGVGNGGKKEGAGRPIGLKQKPISVRLDIDLFEKLSDIPNRNRFINNAVREKLDRNDRKPEE